MLVSATKPLLLAASSSNITRSSQSAYFGAVHPEFTPDADRIYYDCELGCDAGSLPAADLSTTNPFAKFASWMKQVKGWRCN